MLITDDGVYQKNDFNVFILEFSEKDTKHKYSC